MTIIGVIVALIALLIGFLLGWLVEWRIDLAYWRSYFEEAHEDDPATLAALPPAAALQLPPGSQEVLLHSLREQLSQRDADLAALRTTISQLNSNDLYWRGREAELMEEARRLRAQLDELTEAKQDAEAEWRHELARREQQWLESKDADLAALRAEAQLLREQLVETKERMEAEWRAELERREEEWQARKESELTYLQNEHQQLKEALAEVEQRFERYRQNHPTELSTIRGIGPKIEADLRRAGINSYSELARHTPEDLRIILNPPKWRKLDFESWIAQADLLAKNEEA
jgi:predicted flap endonuclease-1-like 5' DNA nuclease